MIYQEQNNNLSKKIGKYEDIIKKYKAESCFDLDNFNSDEENSKTIKTVCYYL